jgi:hypothetical protein
MQVCMQCAVLFTQWIQPQQVSKGRPSQVWVVCSFGHCVGGLLTGLSGQLPESVMSAGNSMAEGSAPVMTCTECTSIRVLNWFNRLNRFSTL